MERRFRYIEGVPRCVVIGARRRRQGIGEFVAASLHRQGAEVAAVVGTGPESVAEAREALRDRYGIECAGYTSAAEAIRIERPEVVAICSPYVLHREHLALTAESGAHALCEKPLWWPEAGLSSSCGEFRTATERIVEGFASRGLLLGTITQWPWTAGAYFRLFPELVRARVERFDMELGPISTGAAMVLDAAPHALSVLGRLVGPGVVADVRPRFDGEDRSRMDLEFTYRAQVTTPTPDLHEGREVAARCRFVRTERPPRPAAWGINGRIARRAIRLPEYRMHFEAEGRRVELEDPLPLLVRSFLDRVREGAPTDRVGLVAEAVALDTLVRETCRALEGRDVTGREDRDAGREDRDAGREDGTPSRASAKAPSPGPSVPESEDQR